MLSDLAVKSARAKEKSYRLRDDRGLYLRVDPNGRKYWIFRYWEKKEEHQLSLGPYPDVKLKDARTRRDEIRAARARGESPNQNRTLQVPNLDEVVKEWLDVRMNGKSTGYLKAVHLRLNKYIFPTMGKCSISAITSGDVLRMCRRIEAAGHVETAHRVKVITGQIFRYAIAAGYVETDPSAAITGALKTPETRHMATLSDPAQIAALLRAIYAYPYPVMKAAMLFSIYTAARPGEVRRAEWQEIGSDLWDIPAGKMKMKRRHLVPLSRQCRNTVDELRTWTGAGRYLFPSARNDDRPLSENGVRVTLRSLGFAKEVITPHGFRAMFSTWANEHSAPADVIERQLAHAEKNTIRAAYNHAEYWDQRVKLMQAWGDWLEGLLCL